MKNQNDLYQYEVDVKKRGYRYIAGVDEVGRGPLAAGVLACACILNLDLEPIPGINDSKKLSEKKRQALSLEIKDKAIDYAYGYCNEKEIDELNIYEASKLAMIRAIKALKHQPDYLLIDAMNLDMDIPQLALVKGDALSASIGAASILAKVKRDEIMRLFHLQYPQYGFDKHKGYPTKYHLEQLEKYQPCPIHRNTFKPVYQARMTQIKLNLEVD